MALAHLLGQAGYQPERIHTAARVQLDRVGEGFKITAMALETAATVPGLDEQTFLDKAEAAKQGCPVSQALAGPDITLEATLVREAAAPASGGGRGVRAHPPPMQAACPLVMRRWGA